MKRIPYKTQFDACEESGCLTDNRFFVINGYLFDMIDSDDRFFVSVYDADGVFNASYSGDLAISYKAEHFIAGFEFDTQELANVWVLDQVSQRLLNLNQHTESFKKLLALYPVTGA